MSSTPNKPPIRSAFRFNADRTLEPCKMSVFLLQPDRTNGHPVGCSTNGMDTVSADGERHATQRGHTSAGPTVWQNGSVSALTGNRHR